MTPSLSFANHILSPGFACWLLYSAVHLCFSVSRNLVFRFTQGAITHFETGVCPLPCFRWQFSLSFFSRCLISFLLMSTNGIYCFLMANTCDTQAKKGGGETFPFRTIEPVCTPLFLSFMGHNPPVFFSPNEYKLAYNCVSCHTILSPISYPLVLDQS